METRSPVDDVIADLSKIKVEVSEAVELTQNMVAPHYSEPMVSGRVGLWDAENGKPLTNPQAQYQELAWIRRILIHGEDQRARMMQENREAKAEADANTVRLTRNLTRYFLTRVSFGAVNAILLGSIAWRLWV